MTKQEAIDAIDVLLEAPITDRQKLIDSYQILLDFVTESSIADVIPDWAEELEFNTDGSADGKYCKHPDTNGKKRVFETQTDGNTGNEPPTDPNITENDDWAELSQAGGSGIKEWTAGIFGVGLIIVYHDHSIYGPGLAILKDPVRPYKSTNIESEIGAGDWEWIGVKDVDISQHVTLVDGPEVTWDIRNKKVSTATLITDETEIDLLIDNLVAGTHHSIFIKKNSAAALEITPLYHGLSIMRVGDDEPVSLITLSGPAGKLFKLDFNRLEVTEGSTLLGNTDGDSNTKIVALDADTLIALSQRYIRKSEDRGATWGIVYDAGSAVNFNSLSMSGLFGIASGPSKVVITADGGDTWTVVALLSGSYYGLRIDEDVMYYIKNHFPDYRIYKSVDGGVDFDIVESFIGPMHSICKGSSDDVVYVGRNNGLIYKTINAGVDWESVSIPSVSFAVTILKFFTDTLGLAGGANGALYKTTTGGTPWTQLMLPLEIGTVEDVSFIDANKFLVVGSGGVAYTVDGGNSFTFSGTVINLKGISVFDEDNIFFLESGGDVFEYVVAGNDDLLFVVDENDGGGSEKVSKAGDEMSGDLNMGGNFIKNLAQGQESGDAINWDQWRTAQDGVKKMIVCRAASVIADGDIVLSGEQTIGGVVLVEDDVVLLKDQADATENLPYVVKIGTWEIHPDITGDVDVQNLLCKITDGTNADTKWLQVAGSVDIGTTELIWVDIYTGTPDADDVTKGKAKLYDAPGANLDGSITQNLFTETVDDLQDQIDDKLDASAYNDRYKGKYTTLVALEAAWPAASPGDYAQVDAGPGDDVVNYNWDDEEGWIEGGSGSAATDTDALPEGAVNLYFTNGRALAAAPAETTATVGALIDGAANKATPVDADYLGLMDSAAANILKKLSWANLKATLLATWKDATGGLVGMTLFKINFKNAANTFTSFFTNANTAARTYTFQDRDGTIADDTDMAKVLPDTIQLVIDGGGSAITTGVKADVQIPFNCTVLGVEVFADQSGSIVIDIWKDTYANYPPTVADTITASAKPTLSSATKSTDATLTGWTTTLAKGDMLRFNVDSASTATRVTIVLKVTRT